MPILNYSTKIDPTKSIGEITALLAKRGVRKIVADYDEKGNPVMLTFSMMLRETPVFYALPCNWEGVQLALRKQGAESRCRTEDQARRVSWRILKDWIEAQMAIVDAQMASLPEIFLP
jgi:hypothetical protein